MFQTFNSLWPHTLTPPHCLSLHLQFPPPSISPIFPLIFFDQPFFNGLFWKIVLKYRHLHFFYAFPLCRPRWMRSLSGALSRKSFFFSFFLSSLRPPCSFPYGLTPYPHPSQLEALKNCLLRSIFFRSPFFLWHSARSFFNQSGFAGLSGSWPFKHIHTLPPFHRTSTPPFFSPLLIDTPNSYLDLTAPPFGDPGLYLLFWQNICNILPAK